MSVRCDLQNIMVPYASISYHVTVYVDRCQCNGNNEPYILMCYCSSDFSK